MQGDRISTNEKPGCRTAAVMISASPFGSPVNPRAMKLAPDASAMTIGAPPELIDAACAKACLPPSDVAQVLSASRDGKVTSDIR